MHLFQPCQCLLEVDEKPYTIHTTAVMLIVRSNLIATDKKPYSWNIHSVGNEEDFDTS
jgi:hypothetical protein